MFHQNFICTNILFSWLLPSALFFYSIVRSYQSLSLYWDFVIIKPEDCKSQKSIEFFSRSLFLALFEELFFQFILLLIMYTWIWVCANECRYLKRAEGVVTLGARVTEYCELPNMGAGNQSQSLWQWAPLIATAPRHIKVSWKCMFNSLLRQRILWCVGLSLIEVLSINQNANLKHQFRFFPKKWQECHFFLLWWRMQGYQEGGGRKILKRKEIQKMNSYKWYRAKRIQH